MPESESAPPIIFTWEGDQFLPAGTHWAKLADQHYVIGQKYRLVEYHDRSLNSHNHYFAAIADAWQNLPDDLHQRFPSPEHLRKYALVRTGYCDSHTMVLDTPEQAADVGRFMRPVDEFGVLVVKDCTITRFTAKSQSKKAMGKEAFGKSKSDVLAYIASMLGTTQTALEQNSGKSGDGKR